jgi:hypothetical protein
MEAVRQRAGDGLITVQKHGGRHDPVRSGAVHSQSDAPAKGRHPGRAALRTGDAAFDQAWAPDRSPDGAGVVRYALE